MKKFTSRQILILNALFENSAPVSSKELSVICSVSTKTIRKDIKNLNSPLEKNYGAKIVAVPGSGFRIDFGDRYNNSKLKPLFATSGGDNDLKKRMHYIIQRFLCTPGVVRSADLAEELFVPIHTISTSLPQIRSFFSDYGITIKSIRGRGLKAEGRGQYFLHCMIDEYDYYQSMASSIYECKEFGDLFELKDKAGYVEIQDLLHRHLSNTGTDAPFNLMSSYKRKLLYAIVLCFADKRVHVPEYTVDEIYEMQSTRSNLWAQAVLMESGERLHQVCDRTYALWLGNLFLCYRSFITFRDISLKESYYKASNVIINTLKQVGEMFGLEDLQYNRSLFESLSCHLLSMQVRIKHRVILTDISMREFAKKSLLASELSVSICWILSRYFHCPIHQTEVEYMAVKLLPHVSSFPNLFRVNTRVGIISECLPHDIAYSVVQYATQKYQGFYSELQAMEKSQLENMDASRAFDLIITDIPSDIPDDLAGTVIDYSFALTPGDDNKLRKWYEYGELKASIILALMNPGTLFLNCSATNKEAALQLAAHRMSFYYADAEKESKILHDLEERDYLCPAPLHHQVGLLKTLNPYSEKNELFLFRFEKPVPWNNQSLQILFIFSTGRMSSTDFQVLANGFERILGNRLSSELVKQDSYQNIIGLIRSLLVE